MLFVDQPPVLPRSATVQQCWRYRICVRTLEELHALASVHTWVFFRIFKWKVKTVIHLCFSLC